MAYRLKTIRYQDRDCRILLQNENGPCPLLAAANALLLKGTIQLPSNCIGAGVVTIDQLVNVLGEKVLTLHSSTESQHYITEVMEIFPTLQYGMDVNPKFTSGPQGYEYTKHLNAFDLLNVKLLHGWLLDPESSIYDLIHNKSYNELIEQVIQGRDAKNELEQLQLLQQQQQLNFKADTQKMQQLSTVATNGSLIHDFLESSAHQLTQYGLHVLYEQLQEQDLTVFFRNNHFNTLTKHHGVLYLLVTDLGYANVPDVVWEKLDVIDGDTEYVTATFGPPTPYETNAPVSSITGEQMLANQAQSQADYHLALQLSRETSSGANMAATTTTSNTTTPTAAVTTAINNATTTTTPNNNNNIIPEDDPEMEAAKRASLAAFNNHNNNNQQQSLLSSSTAAAAAAPASNIINDEPVFVELPPSVAVGVPADEALARQLMQDQQNQASLDLVRRLEEEQKQMHQRRQRSVQPAPPPRRLVTSNGNNNNNARGGGGRDAGCIIS